MTKGRPSPAGKQMKRLRQEFRLSQRELAERAGVDPSSVSKVESGVTEQPSAEYLRLIAAALRVPVSALVDAGITSDAPKTLRFSTRIDVLKHQLEALPEDLAESLLAIYESQLEMTEQARKLREN